MSSVFPRLLSDCLAPLRINLRLLRLCTLMSAEYAFRERSRTTVINANTGLV